MESVWIGAWYLTLLIFGVATLPQFFTPNSGFSSVVTLTIAAQ